MVVFTGKGRGGITMVAYSGKAQPYLDAIAEGVFGSPHIRDWILETTPHEAAYRGADVLIEEQRAVRWHAKPTIQPFWANYWCGKDSRCTCRIEGSKGLESDAIFFFRNGFGRVLAVHVEFKHTGENFQCGQPEAYPLRGACFARTHAERSTLNAHNDWTTILFCGTDALSDSRIMNFHRRITHSEARKRLANYPA
jgi:hypothetical protein